MVKIKILDKSYSQSFLGMLYQLDQETDYMLYEPDERNTTLEDIEDRIEQSNKTTWIAIENNYVVGFMSVKRGPLRRNKHKAYIVTGILDKYHGKGIGSQFLDTLDSWAVEEELKRLELTVMRHNEKAIALYEKCGYEMEGVKINSLFVRGEFIDELYMVKML